MADLSIPFAGFNLRNPILSASGTFGHGLEMQHIVPPESLGGLVSKTVTISPRAGNPMPRIAETRAGFLNSIGLENRGLEHYLEHTLPEVANADTMIIANIGGHTAEEFAAVATQLETRDEVDVIEVNLSCPNVDGGKLPYSTDPSRAEATIAGVRAVTTKPILAKVSPNVTDIAAIALACESGGADGITAINTLLGMGVDWRSGKPALNTVVGGYSGVAIGPVALRCAFQCAQAVSIPVFGCGGITSAEEVLEFLAVGCLAVQVGTSSFSDPAMLGRLAAEVEVLLDAAGFGAARDVIGTIRLPQSASAKSPATGR
jgi:dihydroorotate dehydrogenase (NAD+) catalytic subunit